MEQLGGCRGGCAAEIAHFGQSHAQAATRGVASNCHSVHAASGDKNIRCKGLHAPNSSQLPRRSRSSFRLSKRNFRIHSIFALKREKFLETEQKMHSRPECEPKRTSGLASTKEFAAVFPWGRDQGASHGIIS
jgi:hypothetical protein